VPYTHTPPFSHPLSLISGRLNADCGQRNNFSIFCKFLEDWHGQGLGQQTWSDVTFITDFVGARSQLPQFMRSLLGRGSQHFFSISRWYCAALQQPKYWEIKHFHVKFRSFALPAEEQNSYTIILCIIFLNRNCRNHWIEWLKKQFYDFWEIAKCSVFWSHNVSLIERGQVSHCLSKKCQSDPKETSLTMFE
jgi:hypothetical protein